MTTIWTYRAEALPGISLRTEVFPIGESSSQLALVYKWYLPCSLSRSLILPSFCWCPPLLKWLTVSLLLTVPGIHHADPRVCAKGAEFQFFQSHDSWRVPYCCWFSRKNKENDLLILRVVGSNCMPKGLTFISDFAEWMIKNPKFLSLVNIDLFKDKIWLLWIIIIKVSFPTKDVEEEDGTKCGMKEENPTLPLTTFFLH